MSSAFCTSRILLPYLSSQTIPDQSLREICRRAWTVPIDRSVEIILQRVPAQPKPHGNRD